MTFLIILFAIALQVFLTVKKLSPFLSLLIVAIVAGLFLGMQPTDLLKSIEKGVGSTLGGLALIICLGAILGKILEVSGAAEKISSTLIKSFGQKKYSMGCFAHRFSNRYPSLLQCRFCDSGSTCFYHCKKNGLPLLYIAIPMAASLSTTHCFFPPHPGPVVLVNAFRADMGMVLIYGLMMAIPIVIIAGPLLGKMLQGIKTKLSSIFTSEELPADKILPGVFPSFFIALLPVLLISLAVVANQFLPEGSVLRIFFSFIGDSTIALLLSVFAAI